VFAARHSSSVISPNYQRHLNQPLVVQLCSWLLWWGDQLCSLSWSSWV